MLILRRKKNESILIGDNIRITVVESASDGVRLAIDAPKQISILREELSIAEQENKSASSPHITAITGLQDSLKHITFKKNKPAEAEAAKEPKDTAEPGIEAGSDNEAKVETKAEAKSDTEAENDAKDEAKTDTEVENETKSGTKAENVVPEV